MINTKDIDNAVGKHFTDFSDSVKRELFSKLSNHQEIKKYTKEIDSIHKMKSTFNQINTMSKE